VPASPYYPDTRSDDNWLTPEIRQAGDSPARIVPANSRLDWPALLLISQYRYFVLIVLAGVYYGSPVLVRSGTRIHLPDSKKTALCRGAAVHPKLSGHRLYQLTDVCEWRY